MPADLSRNPIHLAAARPRSPSPSSRASSGMQRHVGDGVEGRLVSTFTFDAPWDGWEVHPLGAEIVVCTAGEITLIQEIDDRDVRTTLRPASTRSTRRVCGTRRMSRGVRRRCSLRRERAPRAGREKSNSRAGLSSA